MACQELSVTLAVLAPNNTQQFSFGLTKGCNADDSEFWIIDFVFRDRPDTDSDFQDRVKLHVQLGGEDNAAAEKLKNEGLSGQDVSFLSGPVTNRAHKLPAGTTNDRKLSNMVRAIVDQHAAV
jgi:hypothetical protein